MPDVPSPSSLRPDIEIIASIADELPVGVWVARAPGGEFVYANRAFRDIMGMEARSDVAAGSYAEPYGIRTRTGELYPEGEMPFVRALRERVTVVVDDIVIHRHDRRRVHVRAQARPCFDAAGVLTHVVIAFIDISREVEAEAARVESEARLRHAQRMESIGNLAGGIAHDFNNLLGTIKLVAFRLRRGEPVDSRKRELLLIDEATESGAQLTRALLGFAGRGKSLAQRLSLNEVARAIADMVSRAIDRRIEVAIETLASRDDLIADRSQIEQVLMNLMVNARDAMVDGGHLRVTTHDLQLLVGDARARGGVPPGHYVILEVSDSGPGIDPAIRDRIFEPYFTTKTSGAVRGTGLGLATVYGIVESHGGWIEVDNATPSGVTMRLLFPGAPDAEVAVVERGSGSTARLRQGSGTLLLVEDEPMVRRATASVLEEIGYRVIEAEGGSQAIAIYRARHPEIDAVVLDLVMPRMDGRATYLALREIEPSVKVVMVTGAAHTDVGRNLLDAGVRAFLVKPFAIEQLSDVLARIVEAG